MCPTIIDFSVIPCYAQLDLRVPESGMELSAGWEKICLIFMWFLLTGCFCGTVIGGMTTRLCSFRDMAQAGS